MVLVKLLLCTFKVEIVLCAVIPRQSENLLKISKLYVVVRTLRLNGVKLVELFLESHFSLYAPYLF